MSVVITNKLQMVLKRIINFWKLLSENLSFSKMMSKVFSLNFIQFVYLHDTLLNYPDLINNWVKYKFYTIETHIILRFEVMFIILFQIFCSFVIRIFFFIIFILLFQFYVCLFLDFLYFFLFFMLFCIIKALAKWVNVLFKWI